MLPDEQLEGEVAGVERPGERSELRLVDLKAHHLARRDLHPVEAHDAVVLQVRHHKEQGEELALGVPGQGDGFASAGWLLSPCGGLSE